MRSKQEFVDNGFRTAKNAVEKLEAQKNSEFHRTAREQIGNSKTINIADDLSHTNEIAQMENRAGLGAFLSSVLHLTKQGLVFRANDEIDPNLNKLLVLRSLDIPELRG
ncbi:hypothetical protein QAD02_020905 [Eretmocerus hayati]|uniref:Uncharacterized protein n=1 Tax=Eretmocerus hayati TaxID=131215 RepID=A0ACC2PNX9_9HYME|nr:hypothetical protein QAD02_020905 [Eretmocerus hayati]